jgi:hypothetical protein
MTIIKGSIIMGNDFYNSQLYYLVDVFAGEIKKSRINFRLISNSSYNLKNAKEVEIESKVKKLNSLTGQEYYAIIKHKAFIKMTPNKYSDSLDVISSEIAGLFNIPSSKVYYLETNDNLRGVINIDVKKHDEQEISIDKLFNRIINLLKSKNMDMSQWLKAYLALPQNNLNNIIDDEVNIRIVVDSTINIIKSFFRLSDQENELLIKNYILMIFFDLLSNNIYRDFNSYSILLSYQGIFSRLAPIYDYNNELDNKEYYRLNNVYINKTGLLSVLYKDYYKYIREISRGILENYKAYLDSISLIVTCNMDSEYVEIIKNNYKINMDVIKTLELLHEEQVGESKLDIAMTQTSINLTAVNNNQMIHQKYDNYNKNKLSEEPEEVQIKVEPHKKSSVLSNVFMFILGIIFLCLVGVGIAYLIMLYYE